MKQAQTITEKTLMDIAQHKQRGHHLAITPMLDWSSPAARHEHAPSRRNDVVGRPVALVAEGTPVLCRDGAAGRVAAVLMYNDRGYPTHLVVRHGRWRTRLFRVPFAWVTGITPNHVVLGLSKHELQQHPVYRTDDQIADEITHMFHGAESFHACPSFVMVRVDVRHGVVVLRGNVHDRELRQKAEQIVGRVDGVLALRNQLRTDDEIMWQADWVLRHDRRLEVRELHVDSCLGVLHMRGYVASAEERTLAAQIVKQVPGVHAVRNNLLVQAHTAHALHITNAAPAHAPGAPATTCHRFVTT